MSIFFPATSSPPVPNRSHYAGHQFGNFVPQLGDGRAILLGEVVDLIGKRYDRQLKGSGPTRYSRRGDGRAAIGPVIREYILSEAMFALGIPTTRSLAAVSTGETAIRQRILPGAVLTRVASSHLRVGPSSILPNGAMSKVCGFWRITPSIGIIRKPGRLPINTAHSLTRWSQPWRG